MSNLGLGLGCLLESIHYVLKLAPFCILSDSYEGLLPFAVFCPKSDPPQEKRARSEHVVAL